MSRLLAKIASIGLLWLPLAACGGAPKLPLASGAYTFKHKFAEHPSMPSIEVKVQISGRRISVINTQTSQVFPLGVIAQGEMAWHAASQQWIIVSDPAEIETEEVGGCSDGPEVVDLAAKIYWTC